MKYFANNHQYLDIKWSVIDAHKLPNFTPIITTFEDPTLQLSIAQISSGTNDNGLAVLKTII